MLVRKDIQLISNNKAFLFDKVLIAIGVEGNTDNLGLENTLVKVKNKQIITYDFGKLMKKIFMLLVMLLVCLG